MRVVEINGGVFGSTGRIIEGIRDVVLQNGDKMLVAAPVTLSNRNAEPSYPYYKIGSYRKRQLSVLMDRIFSVQNAFAFSETRKLIQEIDRFQPDIIHLHSIHGGYLNIGMFFRYLSQSKAKVVWTLHDCWAFTGHCPHFTAENCSLWMTGCHDCPRYREYPRTILDDSRRMWNRKRVLFNQLNNLVIATPSHWLKSRVEASFLKDYPVYVINNGIDLSVFRRSPGDFKEKHHCKGKTVILGVAFGWGYRKGLDVFNRIAESAERNNFKIVLVGTDDAIDRQLCPDIISIHRTNSLSELAAIYSDCDVFFNPTREDTFPTVNMEALACGLPVVTFPVGGSPEIIDTNCGMVISPESDQEIIESLLSVARRKAEMTGFCVARAAQYYNREERFTEYYNLFCTLNQSEDER